MTPMTPSAEIPAMMRVVMCVLRRLPSMLGSNVRSAPAQFVAARVSAGITSA